jgi:hypothetical protein
MTLSIITGSVARLSVLYAQCRKQTHNAECHYGECRYADCRGAVKISQYF